MLQRVLQCVLQCVAVCVAGCVAVSCSVLQCVLQCVAVCCSVLQCVAGKKLLPRGIFFHVPAINAIFMYIQSEKYSLSR